MLEIMNTSRVLPSASFKGEVSAANFITGSALSTLVGMSQGNLQFDPIPWIKIITAAGVTLYMSKNTIRNTVTWEQLNSLGLVTGTTVVVIAGQGYKVRLLTAGPGMANNSLPAGEYYTFMSSLTNGVWASYTAAALSPGNGGGAPGVMTICQEIASDGSSHASPGYPNLLTGWTVPPNYVGDSNRGWRPVLELISDPNYGAVAETVVTGHLDGLSPVAMLEGTMS